MTAQEKILSWVDAIANDPGMPLQIRSGLRAFGPIITKEIRNAPDAMVTKYVELGRQLLDQLHELLPEAEGATRLASGDSDSHLSGTGNAKVSMLHPRQANDHNARPARV